MPRLSFYVLSSADERQRSFFACKLVEKAYREGFFSYVMTDSDSQSRMLDNLLWTFRPNSFVPHQLYSGELPAIGNNVLIGSLPPPEDWQKVVVNLSSHSLQDPGKIMRLLEVVDNNPERKQTGRDRYRDYKRQGFEIQTYPINL